MSVAQRSPVRTVRRRSIAGIGKAAAIATVVGATMAGCSANITRLDPPSFAVGEGPVGTSTRRSASGSLIDNLPTPAPLRPRGTVEMAGLPPAEDARPPSARALAVTRSPAAATAAPAIPPQQQAAARGQQIEVQPGDTLYGLSRRHSVMISDLMALNDLKSPNLKPGQRLYLPTSASVRSTPVVKPERPVAAPRASKAAPAQAEAGSGGTYTVKPGDSLYKIAIRHKVKVADLQRVNGIVDARAVKPGSVLRIPGAGGTGSAGAPSEPSAAVEPLAKAGPSTPRPAAPTSAPVAATTAPPGVKVLNADPSRQAAVADPKTMSDASPVAVAAPGPSGSQATNGKLRWPAKGRVVQGFGAKADGTHNDGVDIAVPAGTDVLAAERGVVAYAGNEVKTYGNLVLVRHDNGIVTAYANNDKLLVQRGDRVKRGQPIAKAGKTGSADQPQVHFEVRVGAKPVDPIGYLEKM